MTRNCFYRTDIKFAHMSEYYDIHFSMKLHVRTDNWIQMNLIFFSSCDERQSFQKAFRGNLHLDWLSFVGGWKNEFYPLIKKNNHFDIWSAS